MIATPTAAATATSGWQRAGTLIAAIAVALLPKCPACWSVYAGLSSLLGLSFSLEARYLFPLTFGLVVITLLALVREALRYGRSSTAHVVSAQILLGLSSAVALLLGKLALESSALTLVGAAGLAGAWIWCSSSRLRLRWAVRFRTAR